MATMFVKIDNDVYENLVKVAKTNGYETVENLLTAFAKGFSSGCSVTLTKKTSSDAA